MALLLATARDYQPQFDDWVSVARPGARLETNSLWVELIVGDSRFLAALCLKIPGKLRLRVTEEAMWQGVLVRSNDSMRLLPRNVALLIRQERLARVSWPVNAPKQGVSKGGRENLCTIAMRLVKAEFVIDVNP